jgi:hypothetical protein
MITLKGTTTTQYIEVNEIQRFFQISKPIGNIDFFIPQEGA